MNKLLEIFRRLSITVVWIVGGGLSLLMIVGTFLDGNSNRFGTLIIGVGAILVTWVVSKLVNWIFIKSGMDNH